MLLFFLQIMLLLNAFISENQMKNYL